MMKDLPIFRSLQDIITPYLPDEVTVETISPSSHLVEDLGINSSYLVDVVLDMEDEFNITIENEDIEQLETVQDAIALVQRKTK